MKDKFRQHFSEALALLLIAAFIGLLASVLLPQRTNAPRPAAVSINSNESPIVASPSSITTSVQTGNQSPAPLASHHGQVASVASLATSAAMVAKVSGSTVSRRPYTSPSPIVASLAKTTKGAACTTVLRPIATVTSKLSATLPLLSGVTVEVSTTCPS